MFRVKEGVQVREIASVRIQCGGTKRINQRQRVDLKRAKVLIIDMHMPEKRANK